MSISDVHSFAERPRWPHIEPEDNIFTRAQPYSPATAFTWLTTLSSHLCHLPQYDVLQWNWSFSSATPELGVIAIADGLSQTSCRSRIPQAALCARTCVHLFLQVTAPSFKF